MHLCGGNTGQVLSSPAFRLIPVGLVGCTWPPFTTLLDKLTSTAVPIGELCQRSSDFVRSTLDATQKRSRHVLLRFWTPEL